MRSVDRRRDTTGTNLRRQTARPRQEHNDSCNPVGHDAQLTDDTAAEEPFLDLLVDLPRKHGRWSVSRISKISNGWSKEASAGQFLGASISLEVRVVAVD